MNEPIMCRLRDGTLVDSYDGEGQIISLLYNTKAGRLFLRILISPPVSKIAGLILDSRLSAILVNPFIKKNNLNDYPKRNYQSFNDFFTRSINPDKRPIELASTRMISPCDGKITVFKLSKDSHFSIKNCDYTLKSLLRSEKLSQKYCGGYGILLRLSVDDYHHYIYPVSGVKSNNRRINGVFHTVNPRAAAIKPIYRENTREYTLIKFGTKTMLMMEVGAMMVGRISNLHGAKTVTRGEEKGYFEFGGSSIILLMPEGSFVPDNDILNNSMEGIETIVKMGEGIGDLS